MSLCDWPGIRRVATGPRGFAAAGGREETGGAVEQKPGCGTAANGVSVRSRETSVSNFYATPIPLPSEVRGTEELASPALIVFADRLERNLRQMAAIAGEVQRLRPHCKTHKTAEIIRMLERMGVRRHKAATVAEAEMVATAGGRDVLLAYNPVGPNIPRVVAFRRRFPEVRLAVTADHQQPLRELAEAAQRARVEVDVMLDVDTGQHRTGIAVGEDAARLYRRIAELPGVRPAGLHVYDGHNHQPERSDRDEAVSAIWRQVSSFRDALVAAGLPVPEIVCGGTPTFPCYAGIRDAAITLSPGTCVYHDANYGRHFRDLPFEPAAVLLTRVISRPTDRRVTFDLGYKAVASDPPAGRRVFFPAIPDAREVLHNEEHLVIETEAAERFSPGDALFAIPTHVCPTSALHRHVYVARDGAIAEQWPVVARDRKLTV
ncbi:MAG: D-TA family PLP-dependent enzyme [Planctomycetota bacterium]|nr:MAG: D-TA family PLP-dependent enzyme [Planctomycetota bacterium]